MLDLELLWLELSLQFGEVSLGLFGLAATIILILLLIILSLWIKARIFGEVVAILHRVPGLLLGGDVAAVLLVVTLALTAVVYLVRGL